MTCLHQCGNVVPLLVESMPTHNIHRDQNPTAPNRQYRENIPNHFQKPQEDYGVQSDLLDKFLLLEVADGRDPAEQAAAEGWRGMLCVCMFGTRCVNAGVSRAQETEDDEETRRYRKGPYDGGIYGVGLDLYW